MMVLSRNDQVLRVLLTSLLSSLLWFTSLAAHEVQPSIMDVEIGEEAVDLTIEWTIEAPLAGIDLEGLEDTNDAENAEVYDRFRAESSDAIEERFEDAWPEVAKGIIIRQGEIELEPELERVTSPGVGNVELPRTSTVNIRAELVDPGAPVTVGWISEYGPLVVRQVGAEDGYTAYLQNGNLSDPIERAPTEVQPAGDAFVEYTYVGFFHIVPLGLDHILFVLGLFFLALQMGALLWQVTAFTVAHTITLALGATGLVSLSPSVIEPLIAASIIYVGVENLFARGLTPWRPFVVFAFGLLHGLGFATVLHDFGLGASNFVAKLLGFNVGVELGQLAVILVAFVALGIWFGRQVWYRRRIAKPVSIAIALIALLWVFERTGADIWEGIETPFALLTGGGLSPLWTTVGAGIVAGVLTLLVLFLPGLDILRDAAGILTSFLLFLAIVATFTSGAWLYTLIVAIVWTLALRVQSLGGEDMDVA